jgi:hypothetical protein
MIHSKIEEIQDDKVYAKGGKQESNLLIGNTSSDVQGSWC